MKRFVDLRKAAIEGVRFAWWDTIRDRFETFAGEQGWDTWAEFAGDYVGTELARYQTLAPEWTRERGDGAR